MTDRGTTAHHPGGIGRHAAVVAARALLLAAATVCTTLIALPADAAERLGQVEPGTQEEEPGLELIGRSPWVAPEGSAEFSVRTIGETSGSTVSIRVHRPLDTVAELERSLERDVGRVLFRSPRLPLQSVPVDADGGQTLGLETSPGSNGPFTVHLRRPGVHPVVISLFSEDGERLDEIRTPLVRLGDDDQRLDAPSLAVVAEVSAEPTLRPDGAHVLAGRELERLVRHGALLTDHPEHAMTVSVSPDTLIALSASPDPTGASLVDGLAAAADRGAAVERPYVPVSVDSLIAAGLEGLVTTVIERGRAVLTDRLGDEPTVPVWEPAGDLTARGAELLADHGYRSVLLQATIERDGEEPAPAARPLVDAGPFRVEDLDPLRGVLVDAATGEALSEPADERADAGHVAMADLLLRDDGESATVVIRVDDFRPGSVLDRFLDVTANPGSPISVGGLELVDAAPSIDSDPIEWEPQDPVDLGPVVRRIPTLVERIETFAAVLAQESSRADDLYLQVVTAVSRELTSDQRRDALRAVDQTLEQAFSSIYLSGQTDLNLTSRAGTLPIVVHNDNDFPVDVVVRIRSDRLAFPAGERLELRLEEEVQRVDIPVRALATGSVPTFVELRTSDDRVVLDSRRLNVRSTAISGVGLLLSAGALVVLVVWWARNWRRDRARRVR